MAEFMWPQTGAPLKKTASSFYDGRYLLERFYKYECTGI